MVTVRLTGASLRHDLFVGWGVKGGNQVVQILTVLKLALVGGSGALDVDIRMGPDQSVYVFMKWEFPNPDVGM